MKALFNLLKEENFKLLKTKEHLEEEVKKIINSPIYALSIESIKTFVKKYCSKATKKELIDALIYKIKISNDKFKIIFNLCSPNPKIRRTIEFEQITFGGSPGIRTRDPLIKSQVL